VTRAGEDGAASERRRKKSVAERERCARNKAAVTAGDVGALEKKEKKNEGDRQRRKDLKTAAERRRPLRSGSPREEGEENEADRRCRDLKTAAERRRPGSPLNAS